VNVNVTCAGSTYVVNGVVNGNVTANAGDSIFFNLYSCSSSFTFEIGTAGGQYTAGVSPTSANTGVVQFDTNVSTPNSGLFYFCVQNPTTMTGLILIAEALVPATAPGTPIVTTSVGVTDLTLSWTAGTANDCVFSNYLVVVVGTGAAVSGCTSFANASVTSCTATNLTAQTSYSFTVQRICTNPSLNSPVSFSSTPQTTISTIGITICQGTDVCNCGNATTCTCQLTNVCNCQNAGTCICQGGTCNGGNAGMLICNFPTGCNKQCAASCPVCLGDAIGGLFGKSTCVSSSVIVSASGALLALLLLVL